MKLASAVCLFTLSELATPFLTAQAFRIVVSIDDPTSNIGVRVRVQFLHAVNLCRCWERGEGELRIVGL